MLKVAREPAHPLSFDVDSFMLYVYGKYFRKVFFRLALQSLILPMKCF